MIATSIFSLLLLGISGLLLDSHRRARQRVAISDLDERAKRFSASQYRRRMLASGTIGGVGVAIALGPLIPRQLGPMVAYLVLLLSACVWIVLLGLIDLWATRWYYRRLRGEHVAAEIKLARELEAAREQAGRDAERAPS